MLTHPERLARMEAILARYFAGETAKVLAREYGIHPQTIFDAASKRRRKGSAR